MAKIKITHLDGTTSTGVRSNETVQIHAVDAEGVYLGLVAPGEGRIHVPEPPANGTYEWQFPGWQRVYSLAESKAMKWEAIKATRQAVEYGGFTWNGSAFDSDPVSQSKIQGAAQLATLAQMASQPFVMDWTLADNTVLELDGTQMLAVGMALGLHVSGTHQTGRALREQIESATTVEQLDAITWPA